MKIPDTMIFPIDDDEWGEATEIQVRLDSHKAVATMSFTAWHWVRNERSGGCIGDLIPGAVVAKSAQAARKMPPPEPRR